MHIKNITLVQFRNYEQEQTSFGKGLNLITGYNGMGKTNLLDAIYTLCIGKSFFSLTDSELILQSADFFRLEGIFLKNEKQEKIVIKYLPGKRKEIERNGVPYKKMGDHVGLLPVVMIAPDDTRIVKDGSEYRRKLIDFTLSQVDGVYLSQLSLYQKLVEQRNALLKRDQSSYQTKLALLDAIDQQIFAPAQLIYEKRVAFFQEYLPFFKDYYQAISELPEEADFVYESELENASCREIFEKNKAIDMHSGRTAGGIHRDDLQLTIAGLPLKKYGSQGQIKSFVLALKLAQYEFLKKYKNDSPILLLDDIFDKLDEKRVRHILGIIKNRIFGQVLVTDTHEGRLSGLSDEIELAHQNFIIQNGHITT